MDRRKFIAGMTAATVTIPFLNIDSAIYHPLYLKYCKQLRFTTKEIGYNTVVLIPSDCKSHQGWCPTRMECLSKGDRFRILSIDGLVKDRTKPEHIGEWKLLGEPYLHPNEHGNTVWTVACDELPINV